MPLAFLSLLRQRLILGQKEDSVRGNAVQHALLVFEAIHHALHAVFSAAVHSDHSVQLPTVSILGLIEEGELHDGVPVNCLAVGLPEHTLAQQRFQNSPLLLSSPLRSSPHLLPSSTPPPLTFHEFASSLLLVSSPLLRSPYPLYPALPVSV